MSDEAPQAVQTIRVVTDAPLRLDGLRSVLEAEGAYRVEPWPGSPGVAGEVAILILDTEATDHLQGLLRELRRERPGVRVLVLGPPTGPATIAEVIGDGAKGYLSYAARHDEVQQAVAAVCEGSMWAPRRVMAQLLEREQSAGTGRNSSGSALTPREAEVLALLAQGHPNRAIGERLGVDEATVKAHVSRLMRKRGVSNRTALTVGEVDAKGPSRG